jgi:hypothetical protein
VAARIAVWLKKQDPQGVMLSNQDLEILRLLLQGKTVEQISESIGLEAAEVEKKLYDSILRIRSSLERIL